MEEVLKFDVKGVDGVTVKVSIMTRANVPLEEGGGFEILCAHGYRVQVPSDVMDEPCEVDGKYYSEKSLFNEWQDYKIDVRTEGVSTHEINFGVGKANLLDKTLFPQGCVGTINFRNEVGMADLVIMLGGQECVRLTGYVLPRKMTKDEYAQIRDEVAAGVFARVFDQPKKTYEKCGIISEIPTTIWECLAVIRTCHRDLLCGLDILLAQPHRILEKIHKVLPQHKARSVDTRGVRWLEKHQECIRRDKDTFLVSNVLAVRKRITYDTCENRLVKYILHFIIRRLQNIVEKYRELLGSQNWRIGLTQKEIVENKIEQLKNEIDGMITDIGRRLNHSFLTSISIDNFVPSVSLVMTMAPGYRKVYRIYLFLLRALHALEAAFCVANKNIATLYEYWCFLHLATLIGQITNFRQEPSEVFKWIDEADWILAGGNNASIVYGNESGTATVRLFYQRLYNCKTVNQKPDIVLEVQTVEGVKRYIFDAKYRVNANSNEKKADITESEPKKYTSSVEYPPDDAINTMHQYRDAIKDDKNGKNIIENAVALFPCHDEMIYKSHDLYKSIDSVGIGGLPFLPGKTELAKKFLQTILACATMNKDDISAAWNMPNAEA